ncbi:MAG TPA: 4-(cytidine 5'-diphospho)-2-C-methyl-D-erythritol kinase [Ginsengibacter sp.]|nr:4-(cytidine 5'-diphospho)-2-C-methyl-D-erythritol kinase [Ginsengibacter sp.]
MITFPNCKINLGLNILRKREDGFHDLETVFFPINFQDALEIIPSSNKTQITVTGIVAGNPENNLCLKAYLLVKKDYPQLPEINIHLHKAIPIGAGLGGGSADAAFMLELLNTKFNLVIPPNKMFDYALQLGSDCSFFLLNKPCLASGRGEVLEPISLNLSGHKILLVNPGIHISTAEAFKKIIPAIPAKKIKDIILQPIETWEKELGNDFENYVFERYPQVKKIKEDLYQKGAVYAAMSGSGSTIFGIFKKDEIINYKGDASFFYKLVNVDK